MKLKELVQAVARKLAELFPDSPMYVDKITANADGCFLLNIIDESGSGGISCRKNRTVSFDLMYFSRADDRLGFMDWADVLQDNFGEVCVNGQIIHTRSRSARCEEMVYHFLFSVDAVYTEYEPGEAMEGLEAIIERTE